MNEYMNELIVMGSSKYGTQVSWIIGIEGIYLQVMSLTLSSSSSESQSDGL